MPKFLHKIFKRAGTKKPEKPFSSIPISTLAPTKKPGRILERIKKLGRRTKRYRIDNTKVPPKRVK